MRILVIGGTRFVGRHFVDAALARGHAVTLFHRGQSGPDLFPDVDRIQGDRETDLDRLRGRTWDAVVDTCGYRPHQLDATAAALAGSVGTYLFISTISVYRDFRTAGMTESAPVGTLPDTAPGEWPAPDLPITGPTYGPLKALAESALAARIPDRHIILRPGLIVGPHDPYTRFSYWVARAKQGGRMAVVGRPDRQVQMIDARDLTAFALHLLEGAWRGTVQATGPAAPITHADLCAAWTADLPDAARPVWIPYGDVHAAGIDLPAQITTWADLDGDWAHLQSMDIGRALALGLTTRPLAETVRDIRAHLTTKPGDEDVAALAGVEGRLLDLAG